MPGSISTKWEALEGQRAVGRLSIFLYLINKLGTQSVEITAVRAKNARHVDGAICADEKYSFGWIRGGRSGPRIMRRTKVAAPTVK